MKLKFFCWDTYRKRLNVIADPMLSFNADIIAIQELKPPLKAMSEETYAQLSKYIPIWNNVGPGMATLIRKPDVKSVSIDFDGRVIMAEFSGFYFVNVHAPSLEHFGTEDFLDWHTEFKSYLKKLKLAQPVVVGGNFNLKTNMPDVPPEEKGVMLNFLSIGFVDTFNKIHPNESEAYTYRPPKNREADFDRRQDYFFVSESLSNKIVSAEIVQENFESFHRPILLEVDI